MIKLINMADNISKIIKLFIKILLNIKLVNILENTYKTAYLIK